jgi:hypothetical protein
MPIYASLESALDNRDESVGQRLVYKCRPGDYSAFRFVFQIPQRHPCIAATGRRFRAGDLLVFDTNPVLWRNRASFLKERICVIAAADCVDRPRFDLAYIEHVAARESECGEQLRVRRLVPRSKVPEMTASSPVADISEAIERKFGRPPRCIVLPPQSNAGGQDQDSSAVESTLPKKVDLRREFVAIDDIRAVAIRHNPLI